MFEREARDKAVAAGQEMYRRRQMTDSGSLLKDGGAMAGAGCSTTQSHVATDQCCRVPVKEQLRSRAHKACQEAQGLLTFQAKLDALPGADDMLEIIQQAFDLGLIHHRY